MGAADIAEEHHKVLWNYGGTSDEIFTRGWQYIVGIASPASDYFRALPRWLAQKDPELRRIGVLYSQKGTFGTQVNRGVLEAAQETGHSVHSVPLNSPLEDSGAAPLALREANPEALVLAGSFQDELAIVRTRLRWPSTVASVAAVAAGIDSFGSVLGQMSEGVLGPSQWEPCPSLPPIVGPTSNWFVDAFHKEFGAAPNYIAAGGFATGLIAADCIRQAASLETERVRCVASQLDCNTFYGRFRIDAKTGKQVGHHVVLVRWQRCTKNVLPSGGPARRS